ncbi:hypothetical protein FHR76_002196 [Rhizobium sp. RAS22]|uniref:DUF7946 domain-containing protein n=1 Tax=Agrobacterium salinitolerans TaxID=1183413 RepID=A0A9X3KL17_9HYPH|nr:hypothetical protein [Agrobacterium salinitolerans]MBB2905814.1 hypothetical protein [Rhizobium sp. RAS22]MCZ7936662.1 hypothetical protein [Agrobacterium salinitolerans]
MTEQSFGLRLKFEGGDADENQLDAYDGSLSLHGFAQALQIATHAYANRDVTNVATALKGAKVFMKPARQGSFITDFTTVITRKKKGVTLNATTFYDFVSYALNQAVGKTAEQPATAYVRSLTGPEDVFFDELAEELEGSLQRAHRVIAEEGVTSVSVERPRGGGLVIFDQQTNAWVNTRAPSEAEETLIGNVTRFNTVSPNGRAYIDEYERIIPFKRVAEFPVDRRLLLSWSLHESNRDSKKKLSFEARTVESASGAVKRLLISDCARVIDE